MDLVKFKLGDTLQMILEMQGSDADPGIVDQVEASFRSTDSNFQPINTGVNLTWNISLDVPSKRWTLTLGSGSTEVLPAGIYAADVKITFDGGEASHSDMVYYQLDKAVTL